MIWQVVAVWVTAEGVTTSVFAGVASTINAGALVLNTLNCASAADCRREAED